MQYISRYSSPLGDILLSADNAGLTGLWFEGQKFFASNLDKEHEEKELPVIRKTKMWLDIYFSGHEPAFMPNIHFSGTIFQNEVWKILCSIPYGSTVSYGDIAKMTAQNMGRARMSAQAVGRAVGRNNIAIIIPCHRVLGSDGSLTGYAGGVDKKIFLLKLEGQDSNLWRKQTHE